MTAHVSLPIIVAWIYIFNFMSQESVHVSRALAADLQQPLKLTLNIWYRGSYDLGVKNITPVKSGDTIRFFKRKYSTNNRVYAITFNRADYRPLNITVKSFGKRKLLHSSRPPFQFNTGKIDFSDDYVEPNEDFVQIVITFQGNPGQKEDYVFNLDLVVDRP